MPISLLASRARYDLWCSARNHGQNIPVEPANHNYAQLTRDLERVIKAANDRLGGKPTIGIFHSMSARAAMKHAIEIGWRWSALVLFDPPNVPPEGHPRYRAMHMFEHARQGARTAAAVHDNEGWHRIIASRAARGWVAGATT
jgi:pimeloyl-ACP methyl ester carboxylesterase